jgi:predicted TIM-barrel fold metal-dependent hydrolase
MESYLSFMEELKLPMKDKQLIMYENAARLFRIPVREDGPGLRSFLKRL